MLQRSTRHPLWRLLCRLSPRRSELLATYAAHYPERPLATSIAAFAAEARLPPHYAYGQFDGQYRIASALRHLGADASPEELLIFTTGEGLGF